ncbi:hypothetical protein B7494_g351 [Chlorociboria aeruginascens]|nr:hypothetical protein B7494_g351 [Chlorociboria aeruginascens]
MDRGDKNRKPTVSFAGSHESSHNRLHSDSVDSTHSVHIRTNGINGGASSSQYPPLGYDSGIGSSLSSVNSSPDLHRSYSETDFEIPHPHKSHRIRSFGPHTSEAGGPQSKGYSSKIKSYSDDADGKGFPRISRPVELLRNAYDTVVIGSGYGGGVAVSRMARAGHSVCLLERGKEKWPGEYPSGFLDAMRELHVSGDFSPGNLSGLQVNEGEATGLYHLYVGKGQNAFVGNGLGGTSLLNANVFLEVDHQTMAMKCWPEELRERNILRKYYKRVAQVLQPQKYPEDWPELPKLTMLEKQARALGLHEKFYRVPQTTRFMGGPNSTGVEMYPSTLTGMDSTGVNDGSKSSTLVNYLSDAWNWGAEMFCECEVRYIKKHPKEEGYLVFFAWHGSKRGAFKNNIYEDLMWVHAKKCVFLGAGSIGTTEILLRSKSLGLSMSERVGTNMSGNGDILAFGYNTDDEVNAVGRAYPSPSKPIGPTITGIIDCRGGHDNPLDGFVIEEGAIPKALAPLFQTMIQMMPGKEYPEGWNPLEKIKHAMASAGSQFLGPYLPWGSTEKTQVYLIMSHDSNQAILTLKHDKPQLEFLGVGRSEHVNYLNNLLKQATIAVGGTFVQSPFYAALGQQEVTVHPIGGACMAQDGTGETGVTNHVGEIFTGYGDETHPGLIVTDGAVIPTALGVNPFATITALAERAVEHAITGLGLEEDHTKNGIINLFGEPQHSLEKRHLETLDFDTKRVATASALIEDTKLTKSSGFGFSEVMSGFIHVGEHMTGDKEQDFQTAAKAARGLCEASRFFLSVKAWDTHRLVHEADHSAMLTGTFVCASLPGSPFMVQRGDFHLFNVDTQAPGTRNLTYDFDMTSTDGRQLHFHGYKIVDSSVALGPWKFWSAASTLYVTISENHPNKAVVGRGMMHLSARDFLSELLTLRPSGQSFWSKIHSTSSFMSYFFKQSANLFFAPFTYLQYPAATYTGYINETPPGQTIKIVASDGVQTLLHMWEPTNPSIETKNLFFIPGASVDHQIFALPTIEVNAVNYFTRAGYRVYVTVHRICQLMVAVNNWTTFDARLDIRACLQWIRNDHGPHPIHTVAHCMGAVAFSSGLLDGTIPAAWIKGITCSQVFMNPIWAALNMAKVLVGPIPFDKLYQLLWNHRNLNEATHRQINRFFGGVNMTLLHLLMQMGHRGFVTTNAPLCDQLTTSSNIRRLKNIPIMLFSGGDNKVLTPESTDKSYTILRDTFGSDHYERYVIQGYGHLDCWMGREAYRDVYPLVREHVDRVTRGEEYRYREPDWNEWMKSV